MQSSVIPFRMKAISFVLILLASIGLVNAKDIPLESPTVITCKLSTSKYSTFGVYIDSEDTVSGPGNGDNMIILPYTISW